AEAPSAAAQPIKANPPVHPDSTIRVPATMAPPGDSLAQAALEASPRHGEWVAIPLGDSGPKLRSWVVHPERKDKAPVVIVIPEIYGLTAWLRAVADRLAGDGFIAIAPDYLSGLGPGGGGTDSVASRDEAVKLTRGLSFEEVARRTNAARAYGAKLPAASNKVATIGFCWGGAMSFAYAAQDDEPDAAVVFYGSAPDSATLLKVDAPVLGLYGADDARVNATIPAAKAAMAANKEFYEANEYPGAGHGFLRAQGDRAGANARAAGQAWPRAMAFLREHLEDGK
ncbi:MAG: dienelactone hydrolase family protein, partial [Candidatus Eisenbacteria bacterium]